MRKITGMRWFSISSSRKLMNGASAPSASARAPSCFSAVEKYGEKKNTCRSRLASSASANWPSCSRTSSSCPARGGLEQRARVDGGDLFHSVGTSAGRPVLRAKIVFDVRSHETPAPLEIDEKSSSPSASSTRRFWSSGVSALRVTFSVARIVRSATSSRISSSARWSRPRCRVGALGGGDEDLLACRFAPRARAPRRSAARADDLLGLGARLLQALAVFGEQLLGLLARALGGVDRLLDRLLAPVERFADAREGELRSSSIEIPKTSSVQIIRPSPG